MTANHFEDRDTQYAYQVIHDFFDTFNFSGAVAKMENILKTAIGNKPWKGSPWNVLFFMENLENLTGAAFQVNNYSTAKQDANLDTPDKNSDAGVNEMNNVIRRRCEDSVWNSFPRNLTAKQYNNPYKAIKKFCKYASQDKWRRIFKELIEYALTNHPVDDLSYPCNILTVRQRLLQLIEACHLIEVRTYKKVVAVTDNQNLNSTL